MQDNDRGTPEQLRADALIQAAQATLKKDVKGKRNIARIIFGDAHVELARCHIELASVYLELKVKGRDILLLVEKHVTSHDAQLLTLYYHSWACCTIGRAQTMHDQLKEAAASLRDAELMGSECSKMVHSDSGPSPQADGSGDSTHLHFVTMVNVARLEEDIFLALARLSFKLNNYESARSYFTKAVDHHISHNGNSSEGLIVLLQELARAEGYCRNYSAAAKALSTALDISRSTHGEESEGVAHICRALASIRLMATKDALTSLEDGDVTSFITHVTISELSTEDAAEVERLLRRAEGIMCTLLGEEHCEAIECKEDLVRFFLLASRYEEAVSMQRGAVKLKKKTFGTRSREAAYSYKLLGTACMSAGMVQESRRCLEKAMNIYSSVLGENHKETVCVMRSLDLIASFGFSDHQDPLHRRPLFRTVV
eukprot:Em0015g1054a